MILRERQNPAFCRTWWALQFSQRARLFFSSEEEEEDQEEEEEEAMVGSSSSSSSWYNTHYTTYHQQPSTLEYCTYLRTYDW